MSLTRLTGFLRLPSSIVLHRVDERVFAGFQEQCRSNASCFRTPLPAQCATACSRRAPPCPVHPSTGVALRSPEVSLPAPSARNGAHLWGMQIGRRPEPSPRTIDENPLSHLTSLTRLPVLRTRNPARMSFRSRILRKAVGEAVSDQFFSIRADTPAFTWPSMAKTRGARPRLVSLRCDWWAAVTALQRSRLRGLKQGAGALMREPRRGETRFGRRSQRGWGEIDLLDQCASQLDQSHSLAVRAARWRAP